MGTFQMSLVSALVAVLGVVLASVYILLPYQTIFAGPVDGKVRQAADLNLRDKLIMVPLVLAMFGLGFLPGPTLDLIKPDAAAFYQVVSLTDIASGEGATTSDAQVSSEGSNN